LKPRQNFDPCFDVTVVDGLLYFGSSASGAITCLDAAKGTNVWTFFTGGPVRFAPHVANGKLYAGSDDGYVYCLNAGNGSPVWSERVGPTDRMVWGNQRMISLWPVRTSVLVDGSDIYWCAGIFPLEGMYLCKRNASDGSGGWTVTAHKSPQGYLLAGAGRIFVPTGKTYPYAYRLSDGSYLDTAYQDSRDGGCWALLTPDDDHLWSGPNVFNQTQQFTGESTAYLGYVADANYLIADSSYAYYNTDTQIIKINRANRVAAWTENHAYPHALIKSGYTLFGGGDDEIAAFDTSGNRTWTNAVDGKAYGLAVAGGRLFASTDSGGIYAFLAEKPWIENYGDASNVTANAALLTGNAASTGAAPTQVYVCVNTNSDAGTSSTGDWDIVEYVGTVPPAIQSITIDGLTPSTIYYFRFYAFNIHGGVWSESATSFTTLPPEPIVNNADGASNVTAVSAMLTGYMVSTGNAPSQAFILWGEENKETNRWTWEHEIRFDDCSVGLFTTNVTIASNTLYFYRCYATNVYADGWASSSERFGFPYPGSVPFKETFETNPPGMAGLLGPIRIQHGWQSEPADGAIVQSTVASQGDQACYLQGEVSVWHEFDDARSNVWIQLYLRPEPRDEPITIPTQVVAAFWVNPYSNIVAYNSTNTVVLTNVFVNMNEWVQFVAHCDYSDKTWSLWKDGSNVVDEFSFCREEPDVFTEIEVREESDSGSYLDNILIDIKGSRMLYGERPKGSLISLW